MRKKPVLISLVLVLLTAAYYYYKNYYNQEKSASGESAEGSVYEITKVSRYYGSGRTWHKDAPCRCCRSAGVKGCRIKLDSDKQLKETFVEVGDEVKKGDPLFSLHLGQ